MDRARTDGELLIEYARERSELAFAQLVARHVDWVYSAARRQVRDPEAAQDVTQTVFVLLARKAGAFGGAAAVDAWLFRTLHFVAKDALRAQRRRRHHESQAGAQMRQATPLQTDRAVEFDELAPVLERAVAALRGQDQRAVLLRFYERKSYHEVAAALGTTEAAAQMRVSRALAKLRAALRREKAVVPATAAALGESMWQHTASAAPAGLSETVTAAAVSGQAAAAIPALKAMLLTTGAAKLAASFAAALALVALLGGTILFATREPPAPVIGFTRDGMRAVGPDRPRDEKEWRAQFDRAYTLAPDELVKRVAPPFVVGRRDWILKTVGGMPVMDTTEKTGPVAMEVIADSRTGRATKVRGFTPLHVRLYEVLGWVLRARSYEVEAPQALLDRVVTGDWVIRDDSPVVDRVAPFRAALRDCGLNVTIERRRVDLDVFVVSGQMPNPARRIEIFSDKPNAAGREGIRGDDDFASFVEELAFMTGRPIFNESTTPPDMPVTWTRHDSALVWNMPPKRAAAKADMVLANVAKQTGLTFRREVRPVERWFVSSDE